MSLFRHPARLHSLFIRGAAVLISTISVLAASDQPIPDVVWSKNTHSSWPSPVVISPDGLMVASPANTRSIRLSNLQDGTVIRYLNGHTKTVASLAFSPDGTLLASVADDRTLRLWDVATGIQRWTVKQGGKYSQFSAVAFHPDGEHIIADRNGTNAALYRVSDGSPKWEALGNTVQVQSVTCSPDGKLVAAAGGYRGQDVDIRIIRSADGVILRELTTGNSYGVRQLAFSPDGKWLAAGGARLTNSQGIVELWRVSDWVRVHTLPVHAPALAFSPDGKLLVTLSEEVMDFWRMPSAKHMHSFGAPSAGSYTPHYSIAISPDSSRIVTSNIELIYTPNGTLTSGSTVAMRFPVLLEIAPTEEDSLLLGWGGGYTRFFVQRKMPQVEGWRTILPLTTNRYAEVPLKGQEALFRVIPLP